MTLYGFQYDYSKLIRLPSSRQLDELIHSMVGSPVISDHFEGGDVISPVMPRPPAYSSDINAAFLLLADYTVWHITKMGNKHLLIDLWLDGKAIAYKNDGAIEEPALAICRAKLTWWDRIGR